MRLSGLVLVFAIAACAPSERPMRPATLSKASDTVERVIAANYPETDADTVADCITSQLTRDEIERYAAIRPSQLTEAELNRLATLLNSEPTLNCIAAAEVELVPEDSQRL